MIAAAALLIVAVGAAVVVREQRSIDGGAESPDAGARSVLTALTNSDRQQLFDLSNPQVDGRSAGVDELMAACGGVGFETDVVRIRGGYGPEVAWADVRQPAAKPPCDDLVFTFSRIRDRWFVALGRGTSRIPTSSTER